MGWLSFKKPFWGIDVGASSVKAVRLCRTRQGVKLLDIGLKELPTGEGARPQNIADALNELIPEKKPNAVVNLSGKVPVIRYLTLPMMPYPDLAEAVKWEAKKLISLPIDDMVVDFIVAGEKQDQELKQYEIVLVAAERSGIQEHSEILRNAGVELLAVDVNPLSLLNAIRLNYPGHLKGNLVYIDIGAVKTDITILKSGILRFTRRLEMGGDQITRRMEEELNLSYENAEKLKREKGMDGEEALQALLKEEMDRFIVEIQRSMDYYRAQFREGVFQKIILTGGGALLPGFSDYFSGYFDSNVEIDDPFSEIAGAESLPRMRMIAPRFSTGIGLALRQERG